MDVLMCKPTYFDVLEKDKHGNTDMDPLNRPDVDLALTQWTQLVDLYRALGVTVHLINPVQGLPDMTFTANPVFTFTGKNSHKYAMLANFRPERRRAEKEYFDSFFKNILGYTTISIPPELYFEGAGDAIPFGDVIFVGYGFRTAKETLKHLAVIEIMTGKKIVPLELKKTYSWSCNSIPHGHSDDGF
jgi:N-dimethylarginine dimethylaminohydrolase